MQAVGHRAVLEPPLQDERLAPGLNLLTCRCVDHFVVVGRDFLMQALGCMRQQIAVFVDGAALDRNAVPNRGNRILEPGRAVDDEEFRPPKAAQDEVVEHCPPGLGALAAHALDRQQHLRAIGAHPDDDQQRDRCGLAIEPHAHHGAVQEEPYHRLIGQRAGIPRLPIAPHLRQTQLTVSLPTAPPNRARSARRTRRVWCRKGSSRRSAHRPPSCGADRPAALGSSTRLSCRPPCSAGRAAPQSPLGRTSPTASATGGRGDDR